MTRRRPAAPKLQPSGGLPFWYNAGLQSKSRLRQCTKERQINCAAAGAFIKGEVGYLFGRVVQDGLLLLKRQCIYNASFDKEPRVAWCNSLVRLPRWKSRRQNHTG